MSSRIGRDHGGSERRGGGGFRTTRWSIVRAAGGRNDTQSRAALEELCRIYWQPLYVHVRRKGRNHDDAADLVQGFIADLLEKNKVAGADASRGKFRSFLLKAFKNYVHNYWEKEAAAKRSNGKAVFSIDDANLVKPDDPALCHGLSADEAFDLKWRNTILEQAVARLGKEMTDDIARAIFETFEAKNGAGAGVAPKYADVARRIGISEQNVKVRMMRLRRRLGTLIVDEVRQTVLSPEELKEELLYLKRRASEL
jgi:RNA polymerase sigma-70 factor (ECF subfamily)